MAIFAKQAYAAGVDVTTLLAVRFALAAAAFWGLVAARRVRLPPGPVVVAGLALGAVGYAAQAGLYFGALTRIDASLTALLLSAYPALVVAGAVMLRRERLTPPRAVALVLAAAGTALVLLGGSLGAVDGLGVLMGLGAAGAYATYILVADRLVAGLDPFALSALVMAGAAATLLLVGVAGGQLHLGFAVEGWLWLAALAWGSTVVGIVGFFVGLRLVGPGTASIVSGVEPAVTVALATVVLGESIGLRQLVGGALVLAAVVVLQRRPGTVSSDAPASQPAAAAPARALAHESP